MILKTYNYILKKSKSKYSIIFLSFISFIESIFFPLPTDLFIIPVVLANKNKFILIAFSSTIFSVLGGVVSYYLGAYLWVELSNIFLTFFDISQKSEKIENIYYQYGFFAIFIGSFTPFPYKLISFISGILSLPILEFIIFSLIFRGLRFFMVATLIFYFGDEFDRIFKKYTIILTLIIIVILFLGFYLLKIL